MKKFPRPAISFIKQNLKGELVGAEVGVYRGENAESILQTLNIEKLYLIDPYTHYPEYKCKLRPDFEENFKEAKQRLSEFKDKIVWLRKKSSDAVDDVAWREPNLDFVYIDGNHSYKAVMEDLENYWAMLRKGGVLSGHDYQYKDENIKVKEAVDDFVKKHNLNLNLKTPDYWIIK